MREINIKIQNEHACADDDFAGVKGAGNVTALNIAFDESWDGFYKSLLWISATGEKSARIVLLSQHADKNDPRSFKTLVPPEALADFGRCTLTAEGYRDGAKAKSVTLSLEVALAPDGEGVGESVPPTPSETEQLRADFDSLQEELENTVFDMEAVLQSTSQTSAAATAAQDAANSARSAAENALAKANSADALAADANNRAEQAWEKANDASVSANEALQQSYNLSQDKITGILPVKKGGTGAASTYQAALKLGRGSMLCRAAADTELIELSFKNFVCAYGCLLTVKMQNGNTVAGVRLKVNSTEAPVYSAYTGQPLTGKEIAAGQTCLFTYAEALAGDPVRFVLYNPSLEWEMAQLRARIEELESR